MYQPIHFREENLATLHDLIDEVSVGLIISTGQDGPIANLLPLFLDRGSSPNGTLRAHLARNNAQLDHLADNPLLVVFQGASRYVTPSFYKTKQETGKVVPTWNYVMVQVRGQARLVEDADWLSRHIRELTDHHEKPLACPWSVDDAPEDFIKAQIKAIVGIEISIQSIAGKWKVSQNRPLADRKGVAAGMAMSDDAASQTMSALVARHMPVET